MGFDDVFSRVGEFGRYQRRVYLLLCLPAISCALHKLAGVFLLAKADHRCRLPCEQSDASYILPNDVLNASYPWDGSSKSWSSCQRYQFNYTNHEGNCSINSIARVSERCHDWVYDHSKYESSAVIEWNFVCNDAWLRATADSLFMVGVLLGSIIFGDLSDRFGRRPIFFISLVLQVIGGLAAAAMPEYITFMMARMLVGATTSGVFLVAYVIAMEMVGPSKRLIAGVVCQFFFSTGYILTAGFAYFIKEWRILQVALSLPGILFMCYWWFIPESARWLLAQGQKEKAKGLLQKVANENQVVISNDELDELLASDVQKETETEDNTPKPSILDLMRHPNLRRKSCLIFFNWFVNSGTYYGLSWNTSNLGGNDYLNFFISGAVEIPAYSFLLLTLNRWGRKTILCSCMLLGGTALLFTIAVPEDKGYLLITLAMFGKLAITASYGTIYVFTAEQFPTVIRNVALGSASTCARVGGILAPYINLLSEVWQPFPLLIFGALAFIGGLLSLLLPETLHKKLPDTIEEGEKFGKDNEIIVELQEETVPNGIRKEEKETPKS